MWKNWWTVYESPVDRNPRNTRYALLLALGEYTLSEIPESRREALLKQLADSYRKDPGRARMVPQAGYCGTGGRTRINGFRLALSPSVKSPEAEHNE